MRNSLFLFFALLASSLFADNISREKALEIANDFFSRNSKIKNSFSFQNVEIEGRNSRDFSTFYIFNNTQEAGFVIVAGDDLVAPILAYSFEHDFPQSDLPCNVHMWLKQIDAQITYISRNNILHPDGGGSEGIGEIKVDLDTPLWGQEEPYNDLCPVFNGEKTPSGCVMTATAIVMRYCQWPPKGIGIVPGYITETYKYSFPERELGNWYNWENMPYKYNVFTQEQRNDVATLMFDLGMMLKADYAPDGTGAYLNDIPAVLTTYMNYDKNVGYFYRNDYLDDEWNQMLRNELDNNRPIIYGGLDRNMNGGHAFVLDGYTTNNYYSVNWGWDGLYNGYFLLSALEPTGQGTGGNGSNFNYNQSAILGIKKNEFETEKMEFVANKNGLNGFQSSAVSFEVNVPFTISAGCITNIGTVDFTGVLMLGLTDGNGVIKEELVLHNVEDLSSDQGYTFTNVKCLITKPINRGDRIRAFYRSDRTKEWTLIKGDKNCIYELLVADEYTIDESTEITYNKDDQILYIKTKKGVYVEFLKEDGSNLNHFCDLTEDGVVIYTKELEKNTYIIELSKGTEYRKLKFILGNSK